MTVLRFGTFNIHHFNLQPLQHFNNILFSNVAMSQDLISNLDPYSGDKYETGKRRMYVILSQEEVNCLDVLECAKSATGYLCVRFSTSLIISPRRTDYIVGR